MAMAETPAPPRRGDSVLWRGQRYLVIAVTKWTVRLVGDMHDIKIRCLKPVSEGGFDEAAVLPRDPVNVFVGRRGV
jgi:hypothetical protein